VAARSENKHSLNRSIAKSKMNEQVVQHNPIKLRVALPVNP
jgi:hypothetical protein